jgi:hypothetical protein
MQEATLILRSIVGSLDLNLQPDAPVWPVHRITLQPSNGLWMRVEGKAAMPRHPLLTSTFARAS